MRACYMLWAVAALVNAANGDCDACLYGTCYRKHLLPETGDVYGAVYRRTNTLYHFNRENYEEQYIIACKLDMGTCDRKAVVGGVFDLAVDQRAGNFYGNDFGSIYTWNFTNIDEVSWIPTKTSMNKAVWTSVFKDKLYYSSADGGLYVLENGVSTLLSGTEVYRNIQRFIVDKNDDIYFYNYENQRRVLRKLSKGAIHDTGFWDGYEFKMTVDKDDNAIFIDKATLAVYRVTNDQLIEIGTVTTDGIPLFDRDNNMIFYEYISKDNFEVWHYKKEHNVQCATYIFWNKRIITQIPDTEPAYRH